MMRQRLILLSLLTLLIVAPFYTLGAFAQAVFGKIAGTVTDPSGAVVPGAEVVIKDVDRGTEYHATSGGQGEYAQGQLLAGSYSVTVNAPGFGSFTSTVQVHVGHDGRGQREAQGWITGRYC